MTERFNIGGFLPLHMANPPYITYTPTRRALEYAKAILETGRRMNYGEAYTVAQMIDAAAHEDFSHQNGTLWTEEHAAVKAWATALWNGNRAAHITKPTDLNARG